MPLIRTRIAVFGFSEAEVLAGLPGLLDELAARPGLIEPDASWDEAQSRLVVISHSESVDAEAASQLAYDEVWDCVFACLNFTGLGVRFEVEDSSEVADV